MKPSKYNWAVLWTTLCLTSCTGEIPLSPVDFVKWTYDPDNGFVHEREFDDLKFTLRYRPTEEVILSSNDQRDSSGFANALKIREGDLHFTLRLESLTAKQLLESELTSADQYHARIYYFTTEVDQDISLVVDSDTIPCALAHFERAYGITRFNDIAVSFVLDQDLTGKDIQFVYYDRVFGHGEQKFTIKHTDREAIQKLKFS